MMHWFRFLSADLFLTVESFLQTLLIVFSLKRDVRSHVRWVSHHFFTYL
jgi:hypothetical protein